MITQEDALNELRRLSDRTVWERETLACVRTSRRQKPASLLSPVSWVNPFRRSQ